MKNTELNRFSPLKLRNGKSLHNRVVVPPMASSTASIDGIATKKTISHYGLLAESGAALVMVEYTYIHLSGRSEEHQLGIQSDRHISGLTEISKAIRERGALAGIQLTHAGGKTSRDLTGGVLLGPSNVAVPVRDREMEPTDPISFEEILELKKSFLDGVDRAVQAGFDLVEFHAAHGYGLNQWLSPLTNYRDDGYGGSVAKNSNLLLELLSEAKAQFPALLLAVRMPGQDFLEGGLTPTDGVWIAQALERFGIDLIDVSSGIGGWRRPGSRVGQGYLVNEASNIQSAVAIPVIGVGGIETGSFIDHLIRSETISLAAVGRAILKDPHQWKMTQMEDALSFLPELLWKQ